MRRPPWLTAFFAGERLGDLLGEVAYHEIVDGVMLLGDGRTEVGVEVELLPYHFGPPSGRYLSALGTLLRLIPENSRLRFVTQALPEDRAVLERFERQTTDPSEASRVLTAGRRAYLDALRAQGGVRRWRSHLSLAQGRPRGPRRALSELESAEALERALAQRELLLRQASLAGMKPRPLGTDDTFERVFRYLNPSYGDVRLGPYLPTHRDYPESAVAAFQGLRPPTLRAQLLRSDVDNSRRDHLRVGAQHVTMIALYTEPEEVFEKLGNLLTRARVAFTAVVDVWHEDQARAIGRIKNRNRQAYADAASSAAGLYSGPESSVALSAGEALITHLAASGDHLYRVMSAVILNHGHLGTLRDATDRLASDLNGVPGMPFRKLEHGLLKPWLTFAPFSGRTHDEYASLVESDAKAFFPVNGPWRSEPRAGAAALYLTRDHSLAAVDSFDPDNKNPHALFLGAPRSGKSFTAQYQLTSTLRDEAVDAVIIDVGLNWRRTVEHYRGLVVPVDGSGAFSINPFDLRPGQLHPSPEDRSFLLKLFRVMLGATPDSAADEDAILTSAITEAYAAALTEHPAGEGRWETRLEPFTLSGFIEVVQTLSAVGSRPVTADDRKVMNRLASRLQLMAGDSPIGQFLDRPSSLPTADAKVILYETSAFRGDERLMQVGTMLIQRSVWQRALASRRRRTVLVVDEAWLPLQNAFACAYLEDILRRGAKEGLVLWLITHSVGDLTGAARQGVRQGLSTFFVFRLDGEDELLGSVLGLPPETLHEYRTLAGRTGELNEFLFYSRGEKEVKGEILVLRAAPTDYYLFTSDPGDLAKLEQLAETHGSQAAAVRELVRRHAA
jgi:conjugal transfer ATP-binding protein TraC